MDATDVHKTTSEGTPAQAEEPVTPAPAPVVAAPASAATGTMDVVAQKPVPVPDLVPEDIVDAPDAVPEVAPVAPPADSLATTPESTEAKTTTPDAPATDAAVTLPSKVTKAKVSHNSGVMPAIIATVVIVIALAVLAVYAYTQQ